MRRITNKLKTYQVQLAGEQGKSIKYKLSPGHTNPQEGEVFFGKTENVEIGIFVKYGQEIKAISFDDESFKIMYDELDEIKSLLEGLKDSDGIERWSDWNDE